MNSLMKKAYILGPECPFLRCFLFTFNLGLIALIFFVCWDVYNGIIEDKLIYWGSLFVVVLLFDIIALETILIIILPYCAGYKSRKVQNEAMTN
jgi:hypothetical protein